MAHLLWFLLAQNSEEVDELVLFDGMWVLLQSNDYSIHINRCYHSLSVKLDLVAINDGSVRTGAPPYIHPLLVEGKHSLVSEIERLSISCKTDHAWKYQNLLLLAILDLGLCQQYALS